MDKKIFTVYMHIVPNGKRYIGITSKQPNRRWRNGNGYKGHVYFYNAINKYGWGNIKHIIIASKLSRKQACYMEKEIIKVFKSNISEFGYNLTDGGDIFVFNNSVKNRISQSVKSLWEDNDYRESMIKSHKGQIPSRRTIEKRSKALKKSWENNDERRRITGERCRARVGEKRSKEARENMSNNSFWKGKSGKDFPKSIQVLQFDLNKRFINTFESLTDASKAINRCSSNISSACKGKQKTCGGYIWEYANKGE